MNIRAILPLLAVVSLGLSACSSAPKSRGAHENAVPKAGAYNRSDDGRDFARAAAFAAREESRRSGTPIRIVQILRRETQVVAGTNLRIRVTALRNGATPETADIVVFRDLFGHEQLTSWRWLR